MSFYPIFVVSDVEYAAVGSRFLDLMKEKKMEIETP